MRYSDMVSVSILLYYCALGNSLKLLLLSLLLLLPLFWLFKPRSYTYNPGWPGTHYILPLDL